ncbi:glutamine synthetase [Escherichia coli]|uniref:glutamine synthetase family protein n=1 Tax=Escherichia coli TaxID=562 RepID=UPI00077336AB|nr:glutamine synthetase family protein [Escherichia coli]EFB5459619.1 glutamine synthetase [Escherichia coli]EFB5484928.1 glutamine synthetase [Escherichia coli]EFJ4089449.1 glutamine synthetase [Escherichia coli]EFM2209197.1 glutamine synthetase [Escherichia coli]ELL1557698.1 glutamine synthetase [Escherichia coli]
METNIVEVENFVQQSEERRGSAFTQEVKRYLERYPNTQYVDVLLTDLNGCFRGKRIPVSSLKKLEKGCYFPASVFAMDILGNVVEEAGLGQEMGEPDRTCVPVLGSLTPSAADPEFIGQMLLTMVDEDGAPFDVEPRNVLNRLWQQLRQRGLFPVVAVELEFYLLDRQRDAEGYLQPPCAPGTDDRNTQSQVYSVDNLNHFADVLNDIDELAQLQLIPADGAVAEASPGQFEINLYHTDNVLEACDDALALKRLVRLMAEKHKMLAGMIDLMPSSMALLAPNVNSYRRFQPGMYVPTQASWGHNNRTVALRIPCGDRHNHRVEYRVAGADANPYLVMAAIFAGILHGLDNELPLQEEVEGNGLEQEGLPFPIRQSDALGEFIENDHLRRYLGERFCHVYHACKNDELLQFERLITETEIEWMLKNA